MKFIVNCCYYDLEYDIVIIINEIHVYISVLNLISFFYEHVRNN